MFKFLMLSLLVISVSIQAQQRKIPEDCEVLEGWVTVWIDQVRQARDQMINLETDRQASNSDLVSKYEYVKYESERFSEAFKTRCNNQGLQKQD
jgi:hypothetical protein